MILDSVVSFFSLGGGLTGWGIGAIVLFTLLVTHITIASVTIFLHRHQAHRALDLHPIASHFFRFWLWLTTSQVTKEWTSIHRKHHAKCETAEDPHSPQVRGIWKVLLEGAELYRAEAQNAETLSRYGHGTPDDWLERHVYTGRKNLGIFLMFLIDVALFGSLGLTVWAIQMMWIPVTAAGIINGLAHYKGYRNFEVEDASTNISPWGILIGGEELHNNHHTYPTSAKLSNKWYEFDIGWLYISLMSWVGLAHVKKVAPTMTLSAVAEIDSKTLVNLTALRHEVMSKYWSFIKREASACSCPPPRSLLRMMRVDPKKLTEDGRALLSAYLDQNKRVQAMYDKREELRAIWTTTLSTRDEMIARLRQWCDEAEQCGINGLAQMASFVRGCRPA
jgi:stearoyl-CoA desaturase (delta-9 desaturase)